MEPWWKEVVRVTAPVRIAVIGVLCILALFLLAQTALVMKQTGEYTNPSQNTITVSGEGTATAIPDTATVSFAASATAPDVASAQANVTTVINNALASIKSAGISSSDVTTTSFNVSPHYTNVVAACPPNGLCPNTNSVVSGYDVSENVTVKIHDTTKVATVLDGLAKAKVSNVSGPEFVVDDTQAVIAEARGKAIAKAQQDAQKLAAQLGVRLGKVVGYTDDASGNSVVQPMMAGAAGVMAAGSSVPNVPVGQNTYTKNISVTYQIH